jgi:plastocyanin
MPKAARLTAVVGLLLFTGLASTAGAANASVEISGFAFRPRSVTVDAGDTVTWTNSDQAPHSAVFSGGRQTPVLQKGQSAPLTFTTAGTFDYVCGVHGSSMSGTISVAAAATPPPTPVPTPVPTARPTVAPVTTQVVAPTVLPTPAIEPTASPATGAPATSAAPSATTTPGIAAAAPTDQAPAPTVTGGGGPQPLVLGAAAIALIAAAAAALTRIRR